MLVEGDDANVRRPCGQARAVVMPVTPIHRRILTAPTQEIDCGNSGTTMRLLAGLLAGQKFESRLVGDPGLSKRPMDRVIAPLCEMGASVFAEGADGTPPLRIHGGSLRGIQYRPSVASAQVKGALLLAGLFAKGKTTVEEPVSTRNHMGVKPAPSSAQRISCALPNE